MTSKNTSIEWTEKSWQVTRGCSRESLGCLHCYAEPIAYRFSGPGKPFEAVINRKHKKWNGTVLLLRDSLLDPLSWRKPNRVFVNSMSDLFHESIPDDYIAAVFGMMGVCRQHTFQTLTKRAERMAEWFASLPADPWPYLYEAMKKHVDPAQWHRLLGRTVDAVWPLRNVWLGVSVEDQARADERIPELLKCPAAVRWLSCEPLIEAVNLAPWLTEGRNRPSWIVVGGESGPQARPMPIAWADDILRQCRATRTPVFMKQLGARPLNEEGVRVKLKDRAGGDMDEWPDVLRVREYPRASS